MEQGEAVRAALAAEELGHRVDFILDRFKSDDWTWSNWMYADGTRVIQDPDQLERIDTPMKTILSAVTVAGMLVADLSYAQSGADVVKTKGCVACHAADQKKVGPSYKDLAAKYSGDKAAEDKLVAKLKEGKAHPKTAASDSELKAAVAYILSVK